MAARASLSPEARIVFRSADPTGAPAEFAALAREVRDWTRVARLAEREVATTGLWRGLRHDAAVIPTEVAKHLRKSAMMHELRMQHLSKRVQRTTQLLAERKIPCLLLKGAAVGALVDPTFRARPMSDVDLLVRRADVPPTREAILAAGWLESSDPVMPELFAKHHHLPPFFDPQMQDMRIEVHTAIIPEDHSFAFDESHMWAEASPAPAPFTGAHVPSREHLLLHSCVHFAWQHTMQFGAWRSFRVVALITAPAFDWDRFVGVAQAARAQTACYWTLRLAASMCGIAAPPGVLARLAPPTPAWALDALERSFIASIAIGERPASPSVRLTRFLWRAALRPKWSGHHSPGPWDPEQRWERTLGTLSTERLPARFARHLRGYRDWWRFLTETLLRR